MTPTSAQFSACILHQTQNLILYQTLAEPKLTVMNIQSFIESGTPVIELCADVPTYDDFPFCFCGDFPVFFN